MIKYNSNNISDWDFGTSNIVKVYHNNAVCYHKIGATPPFQGKWKATYSGGSITTAACDSTSAITENEITLTDLESVVIGDCVTSIGNLVFDYCTSLTSIDIPNSVTSIGDMAFRRCSSISSVTIPNSVTNIGNQAFQYCSGITSINIPSGVTSIALYTFFECTSLTSIVIPSGVTNIGEHAFDYCSSLTSIDIPSGVTSIGNSAFKRCSSLSSITVNAQNPPTLGSTAFNNTNDCPIYVPSASVEEYKAASGWSTYADRIQAIP